MVSLKRATFCITHLIILACLLAGEAAAQNPDLTLSQAERDSILANYDQIFPIWGKQAIAKGFDLPYSLGLNANFFWMKQGISIDQISIGINDKGPVDLSGVIKFKEVESEILSGIPRVDLWIFPFLNVYGMVGGGTSTTRVELAEPITLKSDVTQNVTSYGVGFTGAMGIKKNWLSLDMNFTWSDIEKLDKLVRGRVTGIRYGRTIALDEKKRLTFWAGAMHQAFDADTKGEISLREAIGEIPDGALDDYQDSEWYQGLGRLQQEVVDRIVEGIETEDRDVLIRYDLDKRPQKAWNMVAGSQIELTKRWFFRGEVGFLGERQSVLLNLNYRLPL